MKKIIILLSILLSFNKIKAQQIKDSLTITDCLIYNKDKTKLWINIDLEIGKTFYFVWNMKKYENVIIYAIKEKEFNIIKKL